MISSGLPVAWPLAETQTSGHQTPSAYSMAMCSCLRAACSIYAKGGSKVLVCQVAIASCHRTHSFRPATPLVLNASASRSDDTRFTLTSNLSCLLQHVITPLPWWVGVCRWRSGCGGGGGESRGPCGQTARIQWLGPDTERKSEPALPAYMSGDMPFRLRACEPWGAAHVPSWASERSAEG